MMTETTLHETKIHGTVDFPYIVYHGKIPDFIKSYPLHWHEEMEIIHVVKGRGKVIVPPSTYEVSKGDSVILFPQTIHSIEQMGEEEMEYFNIVFQFSLLTSGQADSCYEKYFKPFLNHTRTVPTLLKEEEELNQVLLPHLLALIHNRRASYTTYELLVKSNLFAIMHYLNQCSTEVSIDELSRQFTYDKLKRVLYYIKTSYALPITVSEAAAMAGFSDSHFMKLFKEFTGTSFTQYLVDYRLELAAAQLIKSDEKVIEIAANCGFNNHSYFTRSFIRKYGVSPKEYRTRERKNIAVQDLSFEKP